MMSAPPVHLPATASDDDLIGFVDGWIRLMAREDYEAAFDYTRQDPTMRWTPGLLCEVIKSYGKSDPAQRVTSDGSPTDVRQRKNVTRWQKNGSGCIGEIWVDLNIDGVVSDLTATFAIQAGQGGLTIVLGDIHVM